MPECYKCKDTACNVPFSEMSTCRGRISCFTQSKILENQYGEQILSFERGCEDIGDKAQFSMCHIYAVSAKHLFHNLHLNCCDTNNCNTAAFQTLELTRPYSRGLFNKNSLVLIGGLSSLFVLLLVAFRLYIYPKIRAKMNKNYDMEMDGAHDNQSIYWGEISINSKQVNSFDNEDFLVRPLENENELSSCWKLPLTDRRLHKEIHLDKNIGSGGYGNVYKAKWQSDTVAVKIFQEEDDYARELEIYRSMNTSISPHILNFITCDKELSDGFFQYWLITDYCPLGSLFDYLNENTLTLQTAMPIINSILCGMFYLHDDRYANANKPAIAHRDIKSKNILMASPTRCVIADFGMAVTYHNGGQLNVPVNYRVGTKRYMAPEILNHTFNPAIFSSYLMTDVYSVGLVLWEIINRVEVPPNIKAQPFRIPYEGMVTENPSFEEMKHVVCELKYRPKIEEALFQHEALACVARMIQEAWKTKPTSRVTIYYMKKNIMEYYEPSFEDYAE